VKWLTLLLALCSIKATAQTISGIWVGNDEKSIFIVHPSKIVAEIEIKNDTVLTGVTHYYYKDGLYEHFALSGKYFPADSLIMFSEDSTISYNKKNDMQMFQSLYTMKIRTVGGRLQMKGRLREKGKGLFRTNLEAWFDKQDNISANPKNNLTSQSINLTSASASISNPSQNRLTDIQKVIEIAEQERDSIKIEVFDNGIIDNDTVSIYLNDIEIVKNKMVSDNPITFYTNLDKNVKFQKITMVANNMGSIPPNTAMLIITTRLRKYEVYMSSNMEKNAVVEFFFKD